MVLKISITLPGEAVITVEASEPQIVREVVSMALKELPRDLVQMNLGAASAHGDGQTSKNAPPDSPGHHRHASLGSALLSPDASVEGDSGAHAKESFGQFCASIAPIGDMRRVVVAAEGAARHLGMMEVSQQELGPLFDLVEWRHPLNFLLTLRNAARNKFRWLERVPGKPGYYTVTALGRQSVVHKSHN